MAQTTTWNGTGTDWNTAGDWSNGIPVAAGTASFDGTGNANLTLTLSSAGTAQNILFLNNAGAYTIGTTTGPAITLTDGGRIGNDSGGTTAIQTINAPLILAGNYTFSDQNNNSMVVNVGGSISGSATATNTDTLTFNHITSTISGVLSDGVNGGQLAISTGTNGVDLTLSGAETYTGNTNISNNATFNVTGSFGNTAIFDGTQGTLNLEAAGAVSQNTLRVNGGTLNETVANAITGAAALTVDSGSGLINLTQAQDYTGATTISLEGQSNGGTMTISGAGALGNTVVTVGTSGTLNINNSNAISQNTLLVHDSGAMNVNGVNGITSAAGITDTNGVVTITQAQNYTGATNINGGGFFNYGSYPAGTPVYAMGTTPNFIISGSGALGNTAVTVGLDGNQFPGYLELDAAGAISQNTLTVNGGIVVEGTVDPTSHVWTPFSGAITGTTSVYINEDPTGAYGTYGVAYFGGGNTYSGTTTLDDANTSRVTLSVSSLGNGGSASSLGSTSSAASNLIFGGGTLQGSQFTSAQSTDRLFTIGDAFTNAEGYYGNYSATLDSSSADPADTMSFTNTGAIASGMGSVSINGSNLILTGTNTGANTFAPLITNLATFNSASTSLTKSGTGNWILTNANTFTGNTTISGGTLELGNANALQNSAVILNSTNGLTFASGGTYNIWSLNGGSDESLASGVTLGLGGQTAIRGASYNTYNYSGVLSGAGGILQQGGSFDTQIFTAANTYSGGTTVTGGTLESTLATNGTPFGTGSININGGILKIAPSSSGADIADTGASDSGAALTYGGNGTLFLNKGGDNSLTFTVGNGTNPFVRTGTGTLMVQTNSADLGSGENLVANGTVPLTSGIVSPTIVGYNTTSNLIDFLTYGGSYTGFGVANSGTDLGNYKDHATDFTTTAGEIANATANVTATDSGGNPYAIRTTSGNYLNVAAGTTLTVGDGTNPAGLILNGNGYYGPNGGIGAGNGSSVLNFGASQAVIFANNWAEIQPIVTGTGGLVISGTGNSSLGNGGALTLDNNGNTFSGGLAINSGGILAYSGNFTGNQFRNGTLGDPSNVITLNGGSISVNGAIFGIDRNVNLTSLGGTLLGNGNYAANISGSGALAIGTYQQNGTDISNYTSTGFNFLSGDNTFTGGLILNNGFLAVSSNESLGASTSPVIFQGGFLAVQGDTMHDFGSHSLTFVQGNEVAIDIADPSNTFTLSQGLNQGSGGFAKAGSGTLVLTGNNTYTGATSLYGGTLQVQESGGGIAAGSALFFDGGTLDIVGNSTGTTVQNFNGVTMGLNTVVGDATSGGGNLIVDGNGGGGTTVNLGTLPRGTGIQPGSFDIGTANTGTTLGIAVTGNATVTTTTAPDGTSGDSGFGIYGGRVVYTDASGKTNWATSNTLSGTVYTLSGYNGYSNFNNGDNGSDDPTNNDVITSSATSLIDDTALNSLKIANTATGTLNLRGHNLNLMSGGLLFTGSSDYTISSSIAGGTLTSGLVGTGQTNGQSGDDLIIQDYGTGNLTINSVIANGVDGNASTLTKAGPGKLTLSGTNTYTGQTFVNGGILSVSDTTNIASSSRVNLNGGGLEATGNVTSPNVYLGSSGGTLDATAGNVLTIPQIYNFLSGNPAPAGLTINSNGDTGTVFLDYTTNPGGNSFYGNVTIDGGTLRLANYGGTGNSAALGSIPANYISWGGTSGDLQINGTMELVSGLESTTTGAIVENGNGNNSNVLFGVSNGDDETYAGLVEDTSTTGTGKLSFLKAGAGSLNFTNANSSYTGTTEIDGGILGVSFLTDGGQNSSIGASSNAASNLIFGGGTLKDTGSADQTTDRLFTLGDAGVGGNDGTIDSSGNGTVGFTNPGAVPFANPGTHNLGLAGTNKGANTFDPSLGDSTYGGTTYATSLTKSGPGTWVMTNANSYSGGTKVTGGTLYANGGVAGVSSGAGTGPINVQSTGAFGGSGVYRPKAAGITLAAGASLISGGIQTSTTAGPGLTLDNLVAAGVILDATSGGANLTFSLGAGNIAPQPVYDFASTNNNSTFMTVLGNTPGELAFATGDTITVDDLTGTNNLQLNQGIPYLLITAGDGLFADDSANNALYAGITTTGDIDGLTNQDGWVTNLALNGTAYTGNNGQIGLYLYNGHLEVVPEPGTWALMLSGLVLLVVLQRRVRKNNA